MSFGEYLTARRIIKQVRLISDEIERNKEYGGGWSPEVALIEWIKICGPTPIDDYLFRFIEDEVVLEHEELGSNVIKKWQRTFLDLLSSVVRNNSPMEKSGLRSFSEMLKHSRNAEESLLVLHSACALRTREVLKANWGVHDNFGNWLKRIQGQRSGASNAITPKSMVFLSLRHQTFHFTDLVRAELEGTIFFRSSLIGAQLELANLTEANLVGTRCYEANLRGANLKRANLTSAIFAGVALTLANLENANLRGTNLRGTNLRRANLEGANLEGANLEDANLEDANLEDANLEDANLKDANLEGANLSNIKGTYKK